MLEMLRIDVCYDTLNWHSALCNLDFADSPFIYLKWLLLLLFLSGARQEVKIPRRKCKLLWYCFCCTCQYYKSTDCDSLPPNKWMAEIKYCVITTYLHAQGFLQVIAVWNASAWLQFSTHTRASIFCLGFGYKKYSLGNVGSRNILFAVLRSRGLSHVIRMGIGINDCGSSVSLHRFVCNCLITPAKPLFVFRQLPSSQIHFFVLYLVMD